MSTAVIPGQKKESVLVALLCGLSLAISFIAIAGAYIPYLDKVAVLVSVPALLLGACATLLALLRKTRLVLPPVALLLSAVPAARDNWKQMQTVWVESAELCHPTGMHAASLLALVANEAIALDHRNAVGGQVCKKLGKRFTDHDCDGQVGRLKCEP